MSTSFGVHYVKSVEFSEIKQLDTGSHYRSLNVIRSYPEINGFQREDVADFVMYASEREKLLTENEKRLIAIIKGFVGAIESINIASLSERMQELRQAVEKIDGGSAK